MTMYKMMISGQTVMINKMGETDFRMMPCPNKEGYCRSDCPLLVPCFIDDFDNYGMKIGKMGYKILCGCEPVQFEKYPGPKETAAEAAKKL